MIRDLSNLGFIFLKEIPWIRFMDLWTGSMVVDSQFYRIGADLGRTSKIPQPGFN
jgi:hypothetical protein